MEKNKNKQTFESAIKQLEDIVNKLESGNVNLEESVSLYEKATILKNFCQDKLKEVELKIKKIKSQDGKIKKEEFEYN